MRPGIYFCYNQSIHQIYHSLFIAIELSNVQKEYPVVVLSTSAEASDIIESELSSIPNDVRFIKISHPGYERRDFSVNWFVFLCRLRMHRPRAVVVTDYYDNVLRQLLVKTFWVYTFHGPENRGFTDPHIKDYDLIIVPGEGERKRLEAMVGPLTNCAVMGYSKFDYLRYRTLTPPKVLFRDKKPVIMYNPHFDPSQSSFFDMGEELLEALSKSSKYNIIFMPHPDLARKHPRLIDKTRALPGVTVVDRPKINLEYMAVADIYITDVSSAAYEWLYFKKPALFFNTKRADWKNKGIYPVWGCGRVAEDVPAMCEAIEHSLKHPEEFREKRKEVFDSTFSGHDSNASKRAAQTIIDMIKRSHDKPQFFFSGEMGSKKLGLGKLISQLVETVNREEEVRLIGRGTSQSGFRNIKRVNIIPLKRILSLTPLRWDLKTMTMLEYDLFDHFASRYVENSSPVYAVEGMALNIFKKAQRLGLKKILIATSLHIELVWQLHKEEEKMLGYDYEWLNSRLKEKILKEYELAGLIIVPSKLTYQTFLERGISEVKLKYIPQEIDRGYYKRREDKKDDIFRVLYVGRIAPQKGIHYLVKAFQELNLPGSELILFGGPATRKAGEWVDSLVKGWANIKIDHGDPRPAYEQASLLVHPSLQDNTAVTVLEALAYGLPVVVTDNTGAKELIEEGENGFIIPIRDVEAIKEKIKYYYNRDRR